MDPETFDMSGNNKWIAEIIPKRSEVSLVSQTVSPAPNSCNWLSQCYVRLVKKKKKINLIQIYLILGLKQRSQFPFHAYKHHQASENRFTRMKASKEQKHHMLFKFILCSEVGRKKTFMFSNLKGGL